PGGAPAPVDPVTADLAAADQALARQHWLSPRGASVYDLLKRLQVGAPGDPRVAALKQRTADTLDKKGRAALDGQRYGEAEIAYRSLARIDPSAERTRGLARALGGQAELALAAGKRDVAQKDAREAIALDDQQAEARRVLTKLAAQAAAGKKGKRRR